LGDAVAIEFRLFGGVDAMADGRRLDLGPARQRCVLAVLLVELGSVVSTERLIERVWPRDPPLRVRGALQSYVSRLRRILTGADPSFRIDRLADGYRIAVPAGQVDLHRFRRLVQQSTTVERALALCTGVPFAGLDTPWLDHVRTVVETERVAAVIQHADQLLGLGRHAQLIPALIVEIGRHPLHERLAGQLMLAFYRDGQQAEAMRAYHRLRLQLRDELGVAPGPVVQEIYRQILCGDSHWREGADLDS
jgi:DNA-binding SARP family transcriptional activator